ncbi:MAG: hypothetical protein IPK53_15290 [bacterium]|nr:hypothetical protein [bacterium]
MKNLSIFSWIALAVLATVASDATAGLYSIKPRPQQMGTVAVSPLLVDGALYLVMPDNPTPSEANVRDEFVAQLTMVMGLPPVVVAASNWSGEEVSLWIGTADRFQRLTDSLSASQLPGLGVLTHQEEYQLLVGSNVIYLAGFDQLGLQWGLLSLLELIAEVNGVFTFERVYIRDWPDFPKRICTINSSVRIQDQYDYADSLADMAYAYKMDEIEWNDPDGGNPVRSNFAMTASLALRAKFIRRAQFLTMGVDRTALRVQDLSWQEGVPILNEAMTVGSSGFTSNAYNSSVPNGGFETWAANVPTGWAMHPPESYSTISRDNVNRHSGVASVKWANLDAGYDWDRTIHNRMFFGDHRLFKLKFWVKTQNFTGRLRFLVLGDEPVNNHFENQRISLTGTASWTLIEREFSTFNLDTASLWLGPDVGCSGNLWIDDVSIEPRGLVNMVRRADTPLQVYKQPGNVLMNEGLDYTVTDQVSPPYPGYIRTPLLQRVSGGQLPVGSAVTVNYYTAIIYQTGRETVCFSLLEPIEYYQSQIRNLDSALAPDGFKIHINEVSLANYDPLCNSRGMSPGQLCGWHCDQLYDVIQSRRPGAPVRIYGDAFDIWVDDNRCHPISTSPWTVGSLQQLAPQMEMMAMSDYSRNLDSTFAFFNANGHNAVMAYYGSANFADAIEGAIAARHSPNCQGFQFYDWDITVFDKLLDFSALGWNFGPFFVHDPLNFTARPDSMRLQVECWADSFRISQATSITARSLSYRYLPGGAWTTITPAAIGLNRYRSVLAMPANATSIEYYFSATDHRGQVGKLPPDAPARVFSVALPPAAGNDGISPGQYDGAIVPRVDGQVIEWDRLKGAQGYEVHWSPTGDLARRRQTIVGTVPGDQCQFVFDPRLYQTMDPCYLLVYPIFNPGKPARK